MVLNKHYYYDEIFQDIKELSLTCTDFTTWRILGTSHDEREIPMIRIGLGMDSLVLTAGIHGRESVNPVLLTNWQKNIVRLTATILKLKAIRYGNF